MSGQPGGEKIGESHGGGGGDTVVSGSQDRLVIVVKVSLVMVLTVLAVW